MQGGDFVFGNGSGGESIFNGKKFKDERAGLQIKHDKKGIVSMGNSGKNSNTSQFFITFQSAPQCDGKHVVFGEVISGFDVLAAVEKVGSSKGGEPTVPIQVTDCGAFHPFVSPGAGYWFDQPDEEDSFSGFTPVFMSQPRVAIICPTRTIFEKFDKFISQHFTSTIPIILNNDNDDDEETSRYTKENVSEQVARMLGEFHIDLAIVAPVFGELFKDFELPLSWKESKVKNVDEVVLVSKPVDAIEVIRNVSWVAELD